MKAAAESCQAAIGMPLTLTMRAPIGGGSGWSASASVSAAASASAAGSTNAATSPTK